MEIALLAIESGADADVMRFVYAVSQLAELAVTVSYVLFQFVVEAVSGMLYPV